MVDIEEGRLRPLGFARDKKAGPYNYLSRMTVGSGANIEDAALKGRLYAGKSNQEAGASSRSQMLR